ncbi:MAG TPA: low temperature requirement protein A [Conexibacter sp.]|nr:low temperature requirement protein A [Conexibacter sp.]
MSSSSSESRAPRFTAVLRGDEERVTPLELFFDLVFVLAITQCTALMAATPTWDGLAQGLLVLGVLWWSWTGYAWLTSVVDPEEGAVRLVMFLAMAAFLVASICVPGAFGTEALAFAVAYGVVRVAHILLFVIASRDDPGLRRAVTRLAISTAIGVGLLLLAAATDGLLQGALWVVALTFDMGGGLVIDPSGWRLVPGHFAERHGLILIIALGESIVAIGAGAGHRIDAGVVLAAVLGVDVAASLWWLYFDVVAPVSTRRLAAAAEGAERNRMARDSFSFLHFPMVAGIVLVAFGLKKTLGHVGDELHVVPTFALLGGAALYLLSHVAFRLRNVRTLNRRRLGLAIVLLALVPATYALPAIVPLALLATLLPVLIAYEATIYGEARERVRHPERA